jgi:CMP-N,N'-diacetyllegionaminic acid synthase
MLNGKTVLGVIPARSGSKRVPRKNTKLFRGKPLIEWTIEAAKQSYYLDKIVLSTDDPVASEIGERMGITVLRRPDELCTDTAKTEDALRHALTAYPMDWVVLLQPTSPLRTTEDIDGCIECAKLKNLAISFVPDDAKGLYGFKKNGAVYVCLASDILKGMTFHRPSTMYLMPPERSLDIDFPEQFE